MNINDWDHLPNTENLPGIPARVTAVHKERYEIVCQYGITHARLKTKEYYVDQQDFPTTGDFVMVSYIENGDSQILNTLPRLNAYLQPGNTVVFLGSSGVGKSSLVNALASEDIMAVNSIRDDDSKGRHTTTHRQLIRLKTGVMIIDTPGMRELGMWDVSEGLGDSFADVEAHLGQCRFSDCRHESEPGCAIKTAIAAGELDLERWESYQKLKEEAVDKAEMLRRKWEWSKGLAKFTRQKNKEIW